MSQCNLFAFHTMFNLLYSFWRRKKKIRGQIAGCGLLLRCMNKSRVCGSWAVCFAAKPHPAHTEISLAISRGGKRRFRPELSAAGHGAPCLGHLAWSLRESRGVGRELLEVWRHFQKIKKTSKCFPSKVTGHLLEGEKQCLSSGLSQDRKTLIPMLQILCYKREGWHVNLRSLSLSLSLYHESPAFISCHLSLCVGGQHRTSSQWKRTPKG